jgi:uncharacterized membrane protein
MSYTEKRTITSIIAGALVLAAYCFYVFGGARPEMLAAGDLRGRAITMLVFIGIGVVAMIIIQIVFHILYSISIAIRDRNYDEKQVEKTIENEMVEDERDKLIELKSAKVGFGVAGFGFVLGLLALVFHYQPIVMLDVLFISFNVASMAEGVASLVYYKTGVGNA